MKTIKYKITFLVITCLCACKDDSSNKSKIAPVAPGGDDINLVILPSAQTGVDFVNTLVETEEVNYYKDYYLLNGAGVGIGDINNDGLQDLFFASNFGAEKLYLNKGNMKFEDISKTAGIDSDGWSSGVSMVDINSDGFLDIYVCKGSLLQKDSKLRANKLFINNGNNTFTEKASEYGIADTGLSTQAAWFDSDLDGDLDLYVLNFIDRPSIDINQKATNTPMEMSDHFYENLGNGKFANKSEERGIHNYGHGLGVGVNDMNGDGYPDIYVANDFDTEDYCYINRQGKGFDNTIFSTFKHISQFSMGLDFADINNDGLIDLFVADMNPEDNYRSKSSMPSMNPKKFWTMVNNGYHYQYMRNNLHLNMGNLMYSEIGRQAGVANTDWSWSPLLVDLNNDGWKDIYISNGYYRDVQNKDFTKKIKEWEKKGVKMTYLDLIKQIPQAKLQNRIYQNNRDLSFIKTDDIQPESFSNGAAYGDLDNDGDMDIVVNNINDLAFVIENQGPKRNYLRIKFNGTDINKFGIGANATIATSIGTQTQDLYVVRGYESSSEPIIHFGLGNDSEAKSLTVRWPDGKVQILQSVKANQLLTVNYKDAKAGASNAVALSPIKMERAKDNLGINFVHKENKFEDYKTQVLLPHEVSRYGPALAIGDVNNDGMQDVFIGGARGQISMLYLQQADGKFTPDKNFPSILESEDVAAKFMDADKDGYLDLIVSVGDADLSTVPDAMSDRFYLNDKQGHLIAGMNLLPKDVFTGGPIAAWDFDSDGDLDLLMGSRVIPDKYPQPTPLRVMENTPQGFQDASQKFGKGIQGIGMPATFSVIDINNDGKNELIAGGEWMPLTILAFENGQIVNATKNFLSENLTGWWFSSAVVDLDNDGDLDVVAGNLGSNYKYSTRNGQPFDIFAKDFDDNGSFDIVLGYSQNDEIYPVRGLQCSSEQMPFVKKEFPTYDMFAKATVNDIYGDKMKGALKYTANEFRSMVLWNEGGKLVAKPLNPEAQIAPIFGLEIDDVNKDGFQDMIIAGNLLVSEVETGNADAGKGLILLNNKNKTFSVVWPKDTGFIADGDVRNLGILTIKKTGKKALIVANNNAGVSVYTY